MIVNTIKVEITKNHTLELYQPVTLVNSYELICENGEELSLRELKALNQAGYVYHGSLTDVDFEDELEDGTPYVGYMDIHYFSRAHENIHCDQIPA